MQRIVGTGNHHQLSPGSPGPKFRDCPPP